MPLTAGWLTPAKDQTNIKGHSCRVIIFLTINLKHREWVWLEAETPDIQKADEQIYWTWEPGLVSLREPGHQGSYSLIIGPFKTDTAGGRLVKAKWIEV